MGRPTNQMRRIRDLFHDFDHPAGRRRLTRTTDTTART
jgi:hypothetical protein